MTRILLILAILIPFIVNGATYYVDATGGDDSKDGLSPTNAWKTIAKVNGYSFDPGDYILFKRGELWREKLYSHSGTSGNLITFGAYGSGVLPIISCADSVAGGSLVQVSGDKYYFLGISTDPEQVFFSDVYGTKVASSALVNSQGKWFWTTSGADSLFVYASDTTDLEYSTDRDNCINLSDESYYEIKDLHLEKARVDAIGDWRNSATTLTGIYLHDLTIRNAWGSAIFLNIATASALDTLVRIYNLDIDWCRGSNGYGVRLDGVTGNQNFKDVKLYSSTINYTNQDGVRFDCVQDAEIYLLVGDSTGYAEPAGFIMTGASSMDVDIYRNKGTNSGAEGLWISGQTDTTRLIRAYYNYFHGGPNGTSAGFLIEERADSILIYNNVFDYYDGGAYFGNQGYCTNIILKNNIFDRLTKVSSENFHAENGSTYETDYNIWDENQDQKFYIGLTSYTFAEWQALGNDTHSYYKDPSMVNPPSDFSLQISSVGIDVGYNWGQTQDFIGRGMSGNAWDIGAYEYSQTKTHGWALTYEYLEDVVKIAGVDTAWIRAKPWAIDGTVGPWGPWFPVRITGLPYPDTAKVFTVSQTSAQKDSVKRITTGYDPSADTFRVVYKLGSYPTNQTDGTTADAFAVADTASKDTVMHFIGSDSDVVLFWSMFSGETSESPILWTLIANRDTVDYDSLGTGSSTVDEVTVVKDTITQGAWWEYPDDDIYYTKLDDPTADGDATCIETNYNGTIWFAYGDFNFSFSSITRLEVHFWAKRTNGTPDLRIRLQKDGTSYNTYDQTLTGEYVEYTHNYNTNPETESAWASLAELNAFAVGLEPRGADASNTPKATKIMLKAIYVP